MYWCAAYCAAEDSEPAKRTEVFLATKKQLMIRILGPRIPAFMGCLFVLRFSRLGIGLCYAGSLRQPAGEVKQRNNVGLIVEQVACWHD